MDSCFSPSHVAPFDAIEVKCHYFTARAWIPCLLKWLRGRTRRGSPFHFSCCFHKLSPVSSTFCMLKLCETPLGHACCVAPSAPPGAPVVTSQDPGHFSPPLYKRCIALIWGHKSIPTRTKISPPPIIRNPLSSSSSSQKYFQALCNGSCASKGPPDTSGMKKGNILLGNKRCKWLHEMEGNDGSFGQGLSQP